MIEMKVTGLTIDPFTDMPIIILKDHDGKHAVPIWIGLLEASAIATELVFPRHFKKRCSCSTRATS